MKAFIGFGIILTALGATVLPSSAEQLMTVEGAINKIFKSPSRVETKITTLTVQQIADIEKKAKVSFSGTHSSIITKHLAYRDDKLIGRAYEDTVVGKWGPIHYFLALNADGTIKEVVILDYLEIRGKPIAKKRFLRQYKKKSFKDPVALRKDVDGISGATISSRSLTNGIRKLLHVDQDI